jgi:hypothetical protein
MRRNKALKFSQRTVPVVPIVSISAISNVLNGAQRLNDLNGLNFLMSLNFEPGTLNRPLLQRLAKALDSPLLYG